MNTVLRLLQATLFTLLFFHGLDSMNPSTGDLLIRSIALLCSLAFCWGIEARCLGREAPMTSRLRVEGAGSS